MPPQRPLRARPSNPQDCARRGTNHNPQRPLRARPSNPQDCARRGTNHNPQRPLRARPSNPQDCARRGTNIIPAPIAGAAKQSAGLRPARDKHNPKPIAGAAKQSAGLRPARDKHNPNPRSSLSPLGSDQEGETGPPEKWMALMIRAPSQPKRPVNGQCLTRDCTRGVRGRRAK